MNIRFIYLVSNFYVAHAEKLSKYFPFEFNWNIDIRDHLSYFIFKKVVTTLRTIYLFSIFSPKLVIYITPLNFIIILADLFLILELFINLAKIFSFIRNNEFVLSMNYIT